MKLNEVYLFCQITIQTSLYISIKLNKLSYTIATVGTNIDKIGVIINYPAAPLLIVFGLKGYGHTQSLK